MGKKLPEMTRREFIKGAIATTTILASGSTSVFGSEMQENSIEYPALPYADNVLEPYISANTLSFHYGKHHKAYVDNAIKLIKGTDFENMPIEDIIKKTAGNPDQVGIFSNVAQAWNHSFYWKSMKPNGGGKPKGDLAKWIDISFDNFDKFREEFANAAATQFGSGWAWLAVNKDKMHLKVVKTANADTPLSKGDIPLLAIDVWEHAYYLDYQNRRKDYINDYLEHLVNWDFAEEHLGAIM